MAWWRRMASAISGTIVSDNGLLHLRRQAITGTNADILSAGSSRTIFREIWINAFNSSFKISLLNGLRLLWFLKTLLRHRTWPWYLFFQFPKFSWFHGVWVIDSIRITACEFSVFLCQWELCTQVDNNWSQSSAPVYFLYFDAAHPCDIIHDTGWWSCYNTVYYYTILCKTL